MSREDSRLNSADPLFEQMADRSPAGKIVLNGGLRVVFWNRWMEEASQLGRAQVLGRPFDELFDNGVSPRLLHACESSLRTGLSTLITPAFERSPMPLFRARSGGDLMHQTVGITRLRDEAGRAHCFLDVRDCSGTVEVESLVRCQAAELEERADVLETVVHSLQGRNAELTQVSSDLESFAQIISGELRQPLRDVAELAGVLCDAAEVAPQSRGYHYLENLSRMVARFDTLVYALQEYSRQGSSILEVRPRDLRVLLRRALDSQREMMHERGVELRIPESLPVLRCDADGITQVLQNLVRNAIQYNDKEQPWIEVTWQESKGPPPATTICVRDNGVGIPPEGSACVFDMFRRLATVVSEDGCGIGLAVARKIVERHGGRIWLESDLGKGSAFYFSLPEARVPARWVTSGD